MIEVNMRLNILNGAGAESLRYKTAFTLLCVLFALISTAVFGQNPQSTENKADQTLRSSGRVNPSTLGMEFDLPLGSYPGRGINMPISLSYSSKLWRLESKGNVISNHPSGCTTYYEPIYAEDSASGWTSSLNAPYIEYAGKDNVFTNEGFPFEPLLTCGSLNGGQYRSFIKRIVVHLRNGETHELRVDDDPHFYPVSTTSYLDQANWNATYYAVDGSNLRYVEDSATGTYRLLMTDGSFYDFAASTGQFNGSTARKATRITDRNGNYIDYNATTKVWTDTLGKSFTAPVGPQAPTEPTTEGSPQTYSLPGMTGTYKFHWKYLKGTSAAESGLTDFNQNLRYPGQKHHLASAPWWGNYSSYLFGGWVVSGYLSTAVVFNPIVLTEIELPTGAKYNFTYDVYGRIETIKYPTGGAEEFTYQQIAPLSYTASGSITDITNHGVHTRKVYETAGTGTPYEWTYEIDEVGPQGYKVRETAPDDTVTERSLHRGQEECVACDFGTWGFDNALAGRPYEELHFSNDGDLVSKKLTHWTTTRFAIEAPYAYADWHPRADHEESIVYEPSGNGVSATTKYAFEGDLAYRETPFLVQKVTQYAFVTKSDGGSAAPGGHPNAYPTPVPTSTPPTPVKTAEATYLINDTNYSSEASYYTAQNMTGLVTVSKVRDGSGTLVSQSETVYDEPGRSPGYRGNATTTKAWKDPANSSAYISTSSRFDTYGNQYEATDALGNTATITFDSTHHAFPVQTTSPVPDSTGTYGSSSAFVTTATFDGTTGLPLTTTDPNGLTTAIEYDSVMMRPRYTRFYNGSTQIGPTNEIIYHDESGNYWLKNKNQIDGGDYTESITYLDGLGRAWKTEEINTGGNIFTEKEFDAEGRVSRVTNPYRTGETKQWTTNIYDTASRVVEIDLPDSSEIHTAYGVSVSGTVGVTKTITDQAGKKRKGYTDVLGNMVRVIEDPDNSALATDYTFDSLGNLRKTSQGSQNRYFMHDSLGRLLFAKQVEQNTNSAFSATDPVTGNTAWSVKYLYDDNGNIVSTTNANNDSITASYDRLNRIYSRDYSDSTPDVTFYHDGKGLASAPEFSKGKTTKVTSSVSETKNTSFDIFGRLLSHQQITDGQTYSTGYAYNLSGGLIEETYPSSRVVKNTFDRNGDLAQVQSKKNSGAGYWTYADAITRTSAGGITKMQLGNGHWETAAYNALQQLTQIGLGRLDNSQDLLKLEYKYNTTGNTDNNGSLLEQKITVPAAGSTSGFTATQTYVYDALNRLSSATETVSSSQTWKQEFSYDRYGNRSFVTGSGHTTTLGSCLTNVCNPSISASTNRFTTSGYTYDANGSLTANAAGERFAYDAENHQKSYFEASNSGSTPDAVYSYDGEGKRVKKISSTETTVFVYDMGGMLIAEYSTALAETPQVAYLTQDHLASPRITTNENGAVTNRKDFMAFGDEAVSAHRVGGEGGNGYDPAGIRKNYTGYEKDAESGLEFAQARYYNPGHGRFTSIDPMMASASIRNPQTFNRYSYVLNSPYKFTDPLGLIAQGARGGNANSDDAGLNSGFGIGNGNYDSGTRSVAEELAAGEANAEAINSALWDGAVAAESDLISLNDTSEGRLEEPAMMPDPAFTYIVAHGQPGTVENVGANFYRSMMEVKNSLEAADYTVHYFNGAISTVEGFQGLLDMAKKYGAGVILLFTHGSSEAIYLGDGAPNDINTITPTSVKKLVNRAPTLSLVQIFACNVGATSNGIGAQLAKQLRVTVYAPTGSMVFSSNPAKPTGAKIHPSTGPTYMVHDGNSQWQAFGP